MTKRTPKGKTPSLIGGANGRPIRVDVQRRSECYRCHDEILTGTSCIAIPKLGGAFTSGRRVCNTCYELILKQTADDLEELRQL